MPAPNNPKLLKRIKYSIHGRTDLSLTTNAGVWQYQLDRAERTGLGLGAVRGLTVEKHHNPLTESFERLYDYANGNQYGIDFQYYRGRVPKNDDFSEVKRLSVMDDKIAPCIDRIVHGVLGKMPEWVVDFKNEAQTNEFNAVLTPWTERVHFERKLKELEHTLAWAGSAVIHVANTADAETLDAVSDLAEAMNALEFVILNPMQAQAVKDDFGKIEAYWHLVTREEGDKPLRIAIVQFPEGTQEYIITAEELEPVGGFIPNKLLNRKDQTTFFSYAEIKREKGTMLTPTILDLQDALNLANTYFRRSDELTNFRQMVVINAESPVDPDTGLDAKWALSPDVALELRGLPTSTAEDKLATPDFKIIEPMNPKEHAIPVIEFRELQLLDAFNQSWVKASNSNESADGQRVRRKAFDQMLMDESLNVIAAMKFILNKVAQFAYFLASDAIVNPIVDPRVFLDVSKSDLEAFKAMQDGYVQNLVSLETVLRANPLVDDTDQERKRLDEDKTMKAKEALNANPNVSSAGR
jgi:Phage portal protein, SPP1 Gp6-like